MIKYLLIILAILFSTTLLGEETAYLYLRDNTNYELIEDIQDYVVSSASVSIIKDGNKLIVRNVSLSPITDVYLNLFLMNGDVKTYILKKQMDKNSASTIRHNEKYNFYIRNNLNFEINQDKKQKIFYRNDLYHKYDNKLIQVKTIVQKNEINSSQDDSRIDLAKIGFYKNYLEYRYQTSLSNPLESYRVKQYYNLHFENDWNTTEFETGKLFKDNTDSIRQATTIFDLDENILNFNVSQNTSNSNTDYGLYTISSYGKNRLYFKYKFNQDQVIDNRFHEYNAAYFYEFNTGGNFRIKNIGVNVYQNFFDHYRLDGLIKARKSNYATELNSSYKEFSFTNSYSKLDTNYDQESFYNKVMYSNQDLNLNYTFESNYAIYEKVVSSHSMNHFLSKGFGEYTQGIGFGINENEKSIMSVSRYDNGTYYANFIYNYSFGDNNYKSDRISFNIIYKSDKWRLSDWLHYTNVFNDSSSILTNHVEYSYNFTDSLYASTYAKMIKYEAIAKKDYQIGITLNYTFGKNIDYSNFYSKNKKKTLLLCLDENYNFICDENEYMANQEVVINAENFVSKTTNDQGEITFNGASKINEIGLDFTNKEYILTKTEERGDDWIFVIQRLKSHKISVIDPKTKIELNEAIVEVSCPIYNYSKKHNVYIGSIYNIPYGDCSMNISVLDNPKIALGQDFFVKVDQSSNYQIIEINPLKRKTLYFYSDKNNNGDIDADESISLIVNGTKVNGQYVIDNFNDSFKLQIDSKYNCNYQLVTHRLTYFDDIVKVSCKKK